MISLAGVSKLYAGRRVVDGLNLEIESGSICALVGPSGCGKSTTLRMINALVPADEGTITIDGQDIRQADPAELRRGIGYVVQSGGLFPHWTVAENIATVPRLLHWPQARVRQRVEELIALVGLDDHDIAGRFPRELSGGQQQRVGVARALAADPPILLMDEPFGALDPVTRRVLQDELVAIHAATGKTIVIVSHDMDEALKLADRIIVMKAGRIIQDGSPSQIVLHPAEDLVRDFIGGDKSALRLLGRGRISDVMRPVAGEDSEPSVPLTATLAAALARMVTTGSAKLAVKADDGQTIGMLHLGDLLGGRCR